MNLVISDSLTMTSLEMVEFLNSQRGPDESELRHDNFMAKVPQVIGSERALKFQGTYEFLWRCIQNWGHLFRSAQSALLSATLKSLWSRK